VNRMMSAFVFFAVAGAAWGQVGAPVLGYVPDGSSLRQIHGIAAAGVVEGALSVGRDLALVEVSPSQTLALATASDTGELLVLTPSVNGSNMQVASVNGASAGANRIVFSPNGTAAALWFSSTGHLQIVTGLSAAPAVRDSDASFLGADPSALAVSDDGSWAIGSWAQQVYAFGPNGALSVLPVSGTAQALCFFHSSTNVAVITSSQVVVVSDIGGSAAPNVIWSKPADAVDPPTPQVAVGLAASFDNSRLTVAGNLGGLFTFEMATGAATGADCGCAPTELAGLGGSLFRLTGAKAGTLKLFDAATNEVWFVPLATAAANGGQQ
jgi:hypothetical protein